MKSFNELNLPVALRDSLRAMKFEKPTPIQAKAIPIAMSGKDVIGCAQTGTGKTAAFCIPAIAQLLSDNQSCALVLVPTRELATQVSEVARKLANNNPSIRGALLIGGTPMQPQFQALKRKPRFIIATPGRLIDHLKRKSISLTNVNYVVMDEADRMIDMGFAPQLQEIIGCLPKNRQTLFFSATLPPNIEKLSSRFLTNPVRVTVGAVSKPLEKIKQSFVQTSESAKKDTLLDQLNERKGSILVFARTQHATDRLANYLEEFGHKVSRIHGGRSQGQRNAAVTGFKTGRFRILVATDIAARGIDVAHLAHVINYDLPDAPEDYIHRIGRTARGGADGEAISIVTPQTRGKWKIITRLLEKTGSVPQQIRV